MTAQAKENARLCGLSEAPIRYIVDDCSKFVEREIRRGNRYDGIIMDPPSYGRGPGGEVWKLEDCVSGLVGQAEKLLSDNALFFLLNTYTTAASVRRQCPLGSLTGRKGEQPDGEPETGKRRAFY